MANFISHASCHQLTQGPTYPFILPQVSQLMSPFSHVRNLQSLQPIIHPPSTNQFLPLSIAKPSILTPTPLSVNLYVCPTILSSIHSIISLLLIQPTSHPSFRASPFTHPCNQNCIIAHTPVERMLALTIPRLSTLNCSKRAYNI